MHFYQHNIGDFDKATRHLSRVERSVYRDLIEFYYDSEQPLSLDIQSICRKIIAKSNEESTAVEQVLNEFFNETPLGWYHIRCEEELERYRCSTSQKSEAGKASAAKKKEKLLHALNGNSTSVEQTFNGASTKQEPLTNNQEPIVKTLVISQANDKPDCPHQEIISVYHEVLPQCPKVRDWTQARQTQLRTRWNESADRQNLDYWRRLFEYVGGCDFLTGRTAKPFFADLEWITKTANFTKIRERKYENRVAA